MWWTERKNGILQTMRERDRNSGREEVNVCERETKCASGKCVGENQKDGKSVLERDSLWESTKVCRRELS